MRQLPLFRLPAYVTAEPPTVRSVPLLEDLYGQVPGKPFQPKSKTLRTWLDANYKHLNIKCKENSIDYLKAPRIREVFLQLLIDAAESDVTEPPVTLLQQAAQLVNLENQP